MSIVKSLSAEEKAEYREKFDEVSRKNSIKICRKVEITDCDKCVVRKPDISTGNVKNMSSSYAQNNKYPVPSSHIYVYGL